MNKSDLRGLDKVIKEENAIIKIYMDKRFVRKMLISREDYKDIVIPGPSLKRLLKMASKQLLGKETTDQICVGGLLCFDSELDKTLKDFYFIIFKDQIEDVFKMQIINNDNNVSVLKSEVPFNKGVYGLMDIAEHYLKNESEKEKNF